MSYDIIADVHGEREALECLLYKLGYRYRTGTWRHPEREAIFLGDLIDRGPDARGVVRLVRGMVEAGSAHCVLGNHEFNAIAYHTQDPRQPEQRLRPHTERNMDQHAGTLASYTGHEAALASDLAWFRSLPFWLELNGVRVVHAAWRQPSMAVIEEMELGASGDWPETTPEAFDPDTPIGAALEEVLKGVEWPLPDGMHFSDKDGNSRSSIRVRWWDARPGLRWCDVGFGPSALMAALPDSRVPADHPELCYPAEAPPVLFGHYWLDGQPAPQARNVACLDYSVARGGDLVAYRWDGEPALRADKFVTIPGEAPSPAGATSG